MTALRCHLVIPDTQCQPGAPLDHLRWIGRYIVDRRPDVVVHLGDHWDLPSLSSWDKRGSKQMEGRRYAADVDVGNAGMAMLDEPLRKVRWRPDRRLLRGNHEDRITRAINDDPRLEGTISLRDLQAPGWRVHDFLEPVWIDGVGYSHYWYQPMTSKPYAGTIDNRLKQIGHSFTMGHQQTLMYGVRYVANRSQHGLVCGSAYVHDEGYRGPQGNAHWRGVVVKHEVQGGSYNPMFVSLDYLCRRYERMPLERFLAKLRRQGKLERTV